MQSLVETLTLISVVYKDSDSIMHAKNKIEKGKNWPTKKADIELMNKGISEAKHIISVIDLTDQIQQFLRAISENQATLLDLTPNVLEWIKEKKLEDSIICLWHN